MGLPHNLGRLSPAITSDASLNIGIGVTPSGTYKLDVNGTGNFSGALTGTSFNFSGSGGIGATNSGEGRLYIRTENTANFPTLTLYKNVFDSSTEDVFRVQSFENGVGPRTIFKVQANGATTMVGQLTLSSTITNGTYTYTLPGATGTLALTSNINSAVSGTTNYIPKFTSANVIGDSVIYETASNILINTTDNSGYRLDVNGTGRFTGNLRADSFIPTLSDVPANGLFLPATNAIGFSTNTTERMRITSGGNVLIGTASDNGNKLQVSGSATFSSGIITTAPSSAIGLELRARASDDFSQINFTNNSGSNQNSAIGVEKVGTNGGLMYFYTKPDGGSIAERMRITSGGNVLIGTTTDVGRLLYVNDVMGARGYAIREASANRGAFTTYNLVLGSGTDYSVGIFSEGEIYMAPGGAATKSFTMTTAGAATFSGALTMSAYSFASSAIQFTRAATNTISPAGGNGILVFAGGNAQIRMDTANSINFDVNNSGNPFAALSIRQNGNTVSINSLDNGLPLELRYQNVASGYLGASGSALYAYSTNGGYVLLNASSVWVAASDAKRKRNFETYSNGLASILGLQPKLYNMDFQKDGDEKQVGLIAQEVKQFIPKAYNENGDFIGLDYNAIIVTMVNAIKEQQAQIENLKLLIK